MSDSFVTPRTVTFQALLPWDFPGKNTGVGCHFLQVPFLDPGINPVSPTLAGRFITAEPPGKLLDMGFPNPGWFSCERLHLPVQKIWESWVQSLGQEDPLKEEMATTPVSCMVNPIDRGAW